MKVLLVNGSPHLKGCTFTALGAVADSLKEEGVETEIFQIGAQAVLDCTGCYACVEKGKCVFDDIVNPFVEKAAEFDGFVFGSPVYYAHPSGRILSFLDRAFFQIYNKANIFYVRERGIHLCLWFIFSLRASAFAATPM